MPIAAADTIAAIATAPGRGGVGIVRVSGPGTAAIARQVLGLLPAPRYAHYCPFRTRSGELVDQGIALWFPGPHSFTGEDVLELQGHGGPVVLDMLLTEILSAGARPARPGEFSERAYLNDKLDLAQAEAIADLIDANSQQAARLAMNSLQGKFSEAIERLLEALIELRMYVESAIDFPEEEIDFLGDGVIANKLQGVLDQLDRVTDRARQGSLIREGMNVVILGRPNAGKSSLLNALADREAAIVTDIAGTTRDILREHIHIDGMPLHLIDTAGIHASDDQVEQIGIRKAWQAVEQADRILLLIDTQDTQQLDLNHHWSSLLKQYADSITVVFNKTDLSGFRSSPEHTPPAISLSVKTGAGLDDLRQHLKTVMGYQSLTEGAFSARRRHLAALQQARQSLLNGQYQLAAHAAGELLADDLSQAQQYLAEITGAFTSDDLLGRIFGSFCIGK